MPGTVNSAYCREVVWIMAKGQDKVKEVKKKPEKTLKEKRKEKKEKKAKV